jgi:hypothetical protein
VRKEKRLLPIPEALHAVQAITCPSCLPWCPPQWLLLTISSFLNLYPLIPSFLGIRQAVSCLVDKMVTNESEISPRSKFSICINMEAIYWVLYIQMTCVQRRNQLGYCFCCDPGAPHQVSQSIQTPGLSQQWMYHHRGVWIVTTWFSNMWIIVSQMSDSRDFFFISPNLWFLVNWELSF